MDEHFNGRSRDEAAVLGCTGSQLSFKITAKDSRGTRIREGGSYVTARLTPGSSAKAAGAETVVAEVIDNKDGTYVARYKVPVRGDWEVGSYASCFCYDGVSLHVCP